MRRSWIWLCGLAALTCGTAGCKDDSAELAMNSEDGVAATAAPAPATSSDVAAATQTAAPQAESYSGGESGSGSSYQGSDGGYGSDYGGGGDDYNGGNSGYGSDYGGGGSDYGGGGSDYGSDYGSGGYGSAPAAPPEPPLTLTTASEKAFDQGNGKLAARLAKASAFADEAARAKVIEATRWSMLTKQPELLHHIAVGCEIDAAADLKELNPIFWGVMAESSGQSEGYGSEYGGGGGKPVKTRSYVSYTFDASTKFHTDLEKSAGLMGTELLKLAVSMHSQGELMPLFAERAVEVKLPEKPKAPQGGGGSGYGSGYDSGYGDSGGGYGSDYGSSYGSSYGGGSAAAAAPPAADPLKAKLADPAMPRIAPGLHYVGTGKTIELLKKADEAGYPLLVVYEVTAKVNMRVKYTKNECRAKLFLVPTGKAIAATRTLENKDVAEKTADGKETYVEDAMKPIFEKLQEGLSLKPIPESLTPELIVENRLPTLASDASLDRLDRLFELLLWREKGMLTDEQYKNACEAVLGNEQAEVLLSGSAEEKQSLLLDLI